ncbi:SDR family NAD(P)-dependent oxidoreductase [Pseudonocardia spinosispora]|uniref:SDR family NAD(P)-dependent oxidoreductase n=1 Tax=Pseudonocardia spinosispora TaxID=103441 RepID=UPI000416EC76|nr:SDR family oxidoreductase [Pseudonocardia spinosispora]
MDLELNGRVALVTGGSRGLGLAIARRLLGEGALVELCGRGEAEGRTAVRELGAGAQWSTCDVTDDAAVAVMITGVLERHGRLDVVVNNAGRFGGGPLAELEDETWREGFDTKALGAAHTVRHARAALIASGRGRVVNISGITSALVVPGVAVTGVANAALTALTAYQARDLREYRTTVNCVVPGYTTSGVWEDRIAARAEVDGTDEATARAAILAERGFGEGARWGTPDELASVVAFLASGPASYVSGATIRVDGAQFPAVSAP